MTLGMAELQILFSGFRKRKEEERDHELRCQQILLGEVALLSPISAIPRTCVPYVWWHSQTHLKWPFWKQSEAYRCPVPWEQHEWNGPCDQNRVALSGRLVQSPPTALRSCVGLGPLLWHNQVHGNPNRNIKREWESLQIGKKDSTRHKIIHHGTSLHH